MSNRPIRTNRAASAAAQRPLPSTTSSADKGDRALADIRAWTQLLVARGNRLLELAVREREDVVREQGSPRFGAGKRESSLAKPRA